MSEEPLAGEPIRTCVGCGARAPQSELLRVVASEGAVVRDPDRRALGRGAYLHPDRPDCLARARRRRALQRALRRRVEVPDGLLQSHVAWPRNASTS